MGPLPRRLPLVAAHRVGQHMGRTTRRITSYGWSASPGSLGIADVDLPFGPLQKASHSGTVSGLQLSCPAGLLPAARPSRLGRTGHRRAIVKNRFKQILRPVLIGGFLA
jgi:hypothetical protein